METAQAVYIVDDARASRRLLASRLAACGAEPWPFCDPGEFLSVAERLKPAPLIVNLATRSALSLLDGLRRRTLPFPVVAVVSDGDLSSAIAAMKLGAIDAIKLPLDSGALGRATDEARRRVAEAVESRAASFARQERTSRLTARERDVVAGLLSGKSNKIVAFELGISTRTVEMHRAHLLAKLGARNLAQAAMMLSGVSELRATG
jgi:two-component system response regulator FixJ